MLLSSRWLIILPLLASVSLPAQTPNPDTVAPTAPAAFPATSTPLGQQIAALLNDPASASAHWGIAVTTLDGTPIYGFDEGKLFRPASNAKLFTTSAAMALLGPTRKFQTNIYGNLDPATGVVDGNLTLLGGGDPSFASNDLPYIAPSLRPKNPTEPAPLKDLASLAGQIAAKGVKSIAGNIVGDDTLFPWEPYAESWSVDDLVWYYGAPVSALTIDDNALKLTISPLPALPSPASADSPHAIVQLDQFVPYYTVQNDAVTVASAAEATGVQVERAEGSRVLRIYGSIAVTSKPDVEHVAIDDPALYAAMALRSMLVSRGIEVTGQAVASHRLPSSGQGYMSAMRDPLTRETSFVNGDPLRTACTRSLPGTLLASHTSALLAEDVVYTAKVSQNQHAEVLLHDLGHAHCGDGSTVEGARVVRAFLIHAGLDPNDFFFYDGSGLSAKDVITPRAATTLLAYAATQPWFAQWKAALPVGGEDGTLGSRFKDSPLKDHLFAKTGTLGETNTLSGYLDAASGHTLIFSILVDDHYPGSSADRKTMDKIVEAIAATQ